MYREQARVNRYSFFSEEKRKKHSLISPQRVTLGPNWKKYKECFFEKSIFYNLFLAN